MTTLAPRPSMLPAEPNGDGTVTIYEITSTVSANGDQGADPNKVVAITDVLANTAPTVAAKETFTTLKSAAAGEVLRGVAFAPTAGSKPLANTPLVLSPSVIGLAPGSLASAWGHSRFRADHRYHGSAAHPLGQRFRNHHGCGRPKLAGAAGVRFAVAGDFQVPAGLKPGNVQACLNSFTALFSLSTVDRLRALLAEPVWSLESEDERSDVGTEKGGSDKRHRENRRRTYTHTAFAHLHPVAALPRAGT
jgi:hypothetical protein